MFASQSHHCHSVVLHINTLSHRLMFVLPFLTSHSFIVNSFHIFTLFASSSWAHFSIIKRLAWHIVHVVNLDHISHALYIIKISFRFLDIHMNFFLVESQGIGIVSRYQMYDKVVIIYIWGFKMIKFNFIAHLTHLSTFQISGVLFARRVKSNRH